MEITFQFLIGSMKVGGRGGFRYHLMSFQFLIGSMKELGG